MRRINTVPGMYVGVVSDPNWWRQAVVYQLYPRSGTDSVVDFIRTGGWRSMTNFGPRPIDLPTGRVILSSAPITAGRLDSDVTAWITT